MLIYDIKKSLLQEASLEHNAAAVDFAIDLFGVFGKANALYLCTAFDNH